MKIALLSNKGGVGKTSLAVNLAGALSERGSVLLVDGDVTRSALHWSERGKMPFRCVSERQAPKFWRDYQHAIIDTGARPGRDDIKDLAEICDLLLVVSSPDALALDALTPAIETLQQIEARSWSVVLSLVNPISRAGEEARAAIIEAGWPILDGYVRRYAAYAKAALEGALVRDVKDPHAGDAWSDIQTIAGEILK